MLVYHGSIVPVREPIVKAGRENLDFGQGFYVTDIKEQAVRWASRMGRQLQEKSLLNIYELDIEQIEKEYHFFKFPDYNLNSAANLEIFQIAFIGT